MLLDNQSTEGDVEWTKQHHPNVRCAVAHKNDYLFSYNRLLAQLEEDVVVLLNNDLRVQPDFLTPFLRHFESPDVFAVSGRIYDWEGQNVTSGPVMLEYQQGFYSWRFHLDRQTRSHTLFSSGACMAVDRRKFLELGGFNRLFHPAYCEDLELCFRAWRRGWRCIYEPESVLYHREHASWSDSSFGRVNTLSLRNALLFQWSSLPMQRNRLERNARIANLIVRGLLSGDATWFKAWIRTILFWGKTRYRFRHLKTRETELKQVMQRIAALGWDNYSIKATSDESCRYRLSQ